LSGGGTVRVEYVQGKCPDRDSDSANGLVVGRRLL